MKRITLMLTVLISININAQYADKSKDETITGVWKITDHLDISDGLKGNKAIFPFDLWVQSYSNDIYVRDIHRSFKYGGTMSASTTTPANSWIYSHEWGNSVDFDLGASTVKMRGEASTKKWQWAIRTDSYGGREILSVNNESSGRVGINNSNPSEALDVNGHIKTNRLYLKAGNGIYSLHNNNYILNDHANGNVTLNAAGGDLYLGYINTQKVLLRKNLYDSSGTYSIVSSGGIINQTKTGVHNYFSGNIYLKEADAGSAKLYFNGQSTDMVTMFSEKHGTAGTRMVIEVADDTDDYIQFRHKHHGNGTQSLMDLKMNETIIYKPLAVGGERISGQMLTVHGNLVANEIEVKDILANNTTLTGTLSTDQIIVNANGNTADFVFEEDYQLRELSEVESFITTNKHLPDVPSAATMEEEGVNLAEMNKLLLQKVEELMLYTIEQEKEINKLKILIAK